MKVKHYVLRGVDFFPKLNADVFTWYERDGAKLTVSVGYRYVVFSRECADEAEALELLDCFGRGYEYLGAHWEQVS